MQITNVRIQNFRSIRDLRLDLAETTVLAGQNNAGKTAIIDAIRKAMPRRGTQQAPGFDENDIHLESDATNPKASSGICVDLVCEEPEPDQWPTNIRDDLDDVANIDIESGRRSITLRARYAWSDSSGAFEVVREFLDSVGEPHTGRGAYRTNLQRFGRYLPVFYLRALRDAGDEFSTRSSQFWKQLLKAIRIPAEVEAKVREKLEGVNRDLLTADRKFDIISQTLSGAARIAVQKSEGSVALRLLPMETWDLLSRVDITLRREGDLPWLPLKRQGQGIQSLTVLFLFQAFVDNLLPELYDADSSPVLALEEPETHLHPQACRMLWSEICKLQGQKIITTHSPYFAQYVPFRDIRLIRLTSEGTTVRSLVRSVAEEIPQLMGHDQVMSKHCELLGYEKEPEVLTLTSPLRNTPMRNPLRCSTDAGQRHEGGAFRHCNPEEL